MNVDPEYEALLRGRGATDAEIAAAARGGQHFLNALNTELVVTPRGDMDAQGVADAAGIDVDDMVRWWRALGLADPRMAGATLGDTDVAMAQTAAVLGSFVSAATLDDLLRVFGAATRQVANAGVNAMRVGFEQPLRQAGTSDAAVSQAYDAVVAGLPGVTQMFDALMRRFIVASVYEQVAINEAGAVQTVQSIVFVDLVDYTGLTQRVDAARLAEVLSAFEGAAADVATQHRGRLVKLLGDGAMLSFGKRDDAAAARDIVRVELDLPPRRAGVATGAVLTRQGDFYGTVVNLAARLSGVVGAEEVAVDASAPIAGGEGMPAVVLKGIAEPVEFYRL
jgi:adenylate cyclase